MSSNGLNHKNEGIPSKLKKGDYYQLSMLVKTSNFNKNKW